MITGYSNSFICWLLRLIMWDGVVPIIVFLLPWFVSWLLPHSRGAIEVTAVLLPIVAFCLRYRLGRYCILCNHCGVKLRRVQNVFLCIGLSALFMIDGGMVLMHIMPSGDFTTEDMIVFFASLYSVYFVPMAIALYPGRQKLFNSMSTSRAESW